MLSLLVSDVRSSGFIALIWIVRGVFDRFLGTSGFWGQPVPKSTGYLHRLEPPGPHLCASNETPKLKPPTLQRFPDGAGVFPHYAASMNGAIFLDPGDGAVIPIGVANPSPSLQGDLHSVDASRVRVEVMRVFSRDARLTVAACALMGKGERGVRHIRRCLKV